MLKYCSWMASCCADKSHSSVINRLSFFGKKGLGQINLAERYLTAAITAVIVTFCQFVAFCLNVSFGVLNFPTRYRIKFTFSSSAIRILYLSIIYFLVSTYLVIYTWPIYLTVVPVKYQ